MTEPSEREAPPGPHPGGSVPVGEPRAAERVLHLEDNDHDAEFVVAELRREWPTCEVRRAASRGEFVDELGAGRFDVILSDFKMPRFDGLSALALAKSRQPDVPFVFFSGTLGEQNAVEALKRGAADYVSKDRPFRLIAAIRRALAEADAQRRARAAEAELREAYARFRQLAESSRDVFWFADLQPHRFRYVSPAVGQLWGRPPEAFYADPALWHGCVHEDDRALAQAHYRSWLEGKRPVYAEEFRVVRPDGSVRWVLDSGTLERDPGGRVSRVSGVARDVTEARIAVEVSLRQQRLESIGLLAGGVAHDLNNALAPVLMTVELLRRELPEHAAALERIEIGARRGAGMVRQLLGFARGAEGQRIVLDPRPLLRELEQFAASTFPKSIKVVVRWAGHLGRIAADPTLLHQVLLNLAVNARDAMPKGGELTIEAENARIDDTYAGFVPDANPGAYVVFKVTDTGVGIPKEVMGKIFDPFFTTKPTGAGTGLGLTTVAGIVHNHGGFIRVYSEPARGACFRVYLPAAPAGSAPPFPAAPPAEEIRGDGELVLVVDDEEPVRLLLRELLERFNFRVVLAADGTEALAQVAANLPQLRLVITDERMPHMDGIMLVRTLRHMKPDLRIVAMSGLLDEARVREFKAHQVTELLHKPFSRDTLSEVLRRALA